MAPPLNKTHSNAWLGVLYWPIVGISVGLGTGAAVRKEVFTENIGGKEINSIENTRFMDQEDNIDRSRKRSSHVH